MSRRRRQARPLSDKWFKVTIKCKGSSTRPHASQRVATVAGSDSTDIPYRLRVDYGNLGEPYGGTVGAIRDNPVDIHMTRRFVCRRCGDDLPVRDDKLIGVLVACETSVLSLADLRSRVS